MTLKVKFWHFLTSPLTQFSKFNYFIWVRWFLGKNLSNFVPQLENSTTRIALLRNPQEFNKEDEACFSNWNRHWRKVNLYYKRVSSNFLEVAVKNKCQYLSLYETKLEAKSLSLDEKSELRYLDLSGYTSNNRILEKLLESCHSLQKLSLSNKRLTTDMAYSIW